MKLGPGQVQRQISHSKHNNYKVEVVSI